MNHLVYAVPVEPVGYNNAYYPDPRGKGMRLSEDGRKFHQEMADWLKWYDAKVRGGQKPELPALRYEVTMVFILPRSRLLSKAGDDKAIDTTGMIKLAEDSLARHLGVDDKHTWDIHAYKRVAEELHARPGIVFLVRPIEPARITEGLGSIDLVELCRSSHLGVTNE